MKHVDVKDYKHFEKFHDLFMRDKTDMKDRRRLSMFYLIALNDDLYNHVDEFYNFETHDLEVWEVDNFHRPKPQPWQTDTSSRIYNFALALYGHRQTVITDVFTWGDKDLEYYLRAVIIRYGHEWEGFSIPMLQKGIKRGRFN